MFQVGSLTIEVAEGDITQADVEAICNAANNHLWMGAGVAGAIKRRGGEQVEREAVAKGPVAAGSAVATTAGNLPYRYVIHGAVMGQDLRTDPHLIAETTHNCLKLAEELNLSSIALPAFGTGVGGFSLTDCARIMVRVAKEFADSAAATGREVNLRRVLFVLYGQDAYSAFADAAQETLQP